MQDPARTEPTPPAPRAREAILGIALSLGLGVGGGVLFAWATMPLPWMLGPMVANTLGAVFGLPLRSPGAARPYVVVVIGVMLGSGFTPALFEQAAAWALSLLFLGLYLVISGAVTIPFYRRVAGFDPVTAYFAGMPGGLNEMMVIGGEMGGDERKIVLAHASRILIVVALVAIWFRLIEGIALGDRSAFGTPFVEIPALDLAILAASGVIGFFLGTRLRLPAPTLLGPMSVSALVHLAGWTASPPPQELVLLAQLVLGTAIGCRFVGAGARAILTSLGLSACASLLMLIVTFAFAAAFHGLFGQSLLQVVLAYSPGGLAEMSLVALAMNADIAYVSTHHLVRITLVILFAPLVFTLIRPRRPSDADTPKMR
ncbi:MAG: AbrB family transcriptional regulator [Pseudomonadota bacterium]